MNNQQYRISRKEWRGNLTETIEAYERLGLLKLQARAVYINNIEETMEWSQRQQDKHISTIFISYKFSYS